ncbi:PREDICTED: T-cell surface glycoprotein CD1c-like isoform X2 [Chinchilla lanigera]|uniref:T-cell surface glycoprotein CD1c-like isoform X2 n=1 Tax=Chinchilla lanigera TaxID=34839 RepID=UPI000697AA61|nr:PREDICTED: T-cell surface glycoprotein CD1c-like isoform X2 [Chinchilla lanigera]
MLFPLLPLLAVLLPESGNAKAVQERTTFQLIQISFYANQSWAQNQGSGWLGELQTHGWDSESGTILFLHTWSRGNFSNEELLDLQLLFRFYFIGLTKEVQNYASQLQFKYPFNVQARAGCELHSGESLKTFLQVAFEGSNFMSLRDTTCVPSPEGGSRAQKVCDLVDQYEGIKETANNLMRNTCPRFLLGLLDAGKMDLQRQDGTWYRRVTLDVATEEASGLSCRVRHSSLGDQDIILYWGHRLSMNWIALALVVPLVLLIALGLWCKKRCSYRNIP